NLGWERCRFRDGTKQKRGWKKKETCFEDFSRHRVTDSHNPDSAVASAVTLPVTPTVSPPSQTDLGLTQASPLENLACDTLTPPVEECLTSVTPSSPEIESDTASVRHCDTKTEQKNFPASQIEETHIDVDSACDALTPPVEECLTRVTPSNPDTASDTTSPRHTDTNNEQKNFPASQMEETHIDVKTLIDEETDLEVKTDLDVDNDCDTLTPPVEECLTRVTPSNPDTAGDTASPRHTDTNNEQKNFSSQPPSFTPPSLDQQPPVLPSLHLKASQIQKHDCLVIVDELGNHKEYEVISIQAKSFFHLRLMNVLGGQQTSLWTIGELVDAGAYLKQKPPLLHPDPCLVPGAYAVTLSQTSVCILSIDGDKACCLEVNGKKAFYYLLDLIKGSKKAFLAQCRRYQQLFGGNHEPEFS
ncbi:MAG: hypothetical protein F6K16_28795, partial [Symploca sp. SIO2B6]|nr:hypothetical protein [Symploca sp. SIO2B6]